MSERKVDLSVLLDPSPLKTEEAATTAKLILDCRCELGEGVIYDDRNDAILFTDILGRKFHVLKLNNSNYGECSHHVYDLPKKLGSFGMLDDPPDGCSLPLLCAWEDGFQIYDIEKGVALTNLSEGEDVNPHKGTTRLNDGRVAPEGTRFVCGGYYGCSRSQMKVFRVEQPQPGKLVHKPLVQGIRVTNSICWSLDGRTMYLADSPTRQIYRYDYDPSNGSVCNKSLLHEKNERESGVPDGSVVDAEGFIWNAVWHAGEAPGCVHRIDPKSGDVVFTVHMPDSTSQVSCCCFGGKDLNILFITTAWEGFADLSKEPHAGGLYAVKVPFRGKKESRLMFIL